MSEQPEEQEKKRIPKFKRVQIIKLERLLDMKYKPNEIAEAIGVTQDTVYRSYLPAGAPHERDAKGNVWIVGTIFREWALNQVGWAKRKKYTMQEDEAWCMKCNKAVKIIDPKPKAVNRYLTLLQGKCGTCGVKVNRAISASGKPKKEKARKRVKTASPAHLEAQETKNNPSDI